MMATRLPNDKKGQYQGSEVHAFPEDLSNVQHGILLHKRQQFEVQPSVQLMPSITNTGHMPLVAPNNLTSGNSSKISQLPAVSSAASRYQDLLTPPPSTRCEFIDLTPQTYQQATRKPKLENTGFRGLRFEKEMFNIPNFPRNRESLIEEFSQSSHGRLGLTGQQPASNQIPVYNHSVMVTQQFSTYPVNYLNDNAEPVPISRTSCSSQTQVVSTPVRANFNSDHSHLLESFSINFALYDRQGIPINLDNDLGIPSRLRESNRRTLATFFDDKYIDLWRVNSIAMNEASMLASWNDMTKHMWS